MFSTLNDVTRLIYTRVWVSTHHHIIMNATDINQTRIFQMFRIANIPELGTFSELIQFTKISI